jgi:UDP-GlcNAc:undecaprenyl-phosphate GlcNAc-1-phosphate transferase
LRTFLVGFALAAAVTLLITPLVIRFAPRFGAVDLPGGRRVNKRVIPRLGGLAILAGFAAPLVGLFFWDNDISNLFLEIPWRASALLGGALVMTALGTLDDLRGLRAWHKLLVQVAVAVGAFAAGYRIDTVSLPLLGELEMGIFALPVTVLWIVGIVNAINLIDGLDGLAAGAGFFACVVTFVVGVLSDNVLVSLFAAALGGALVGFLFFNFNPARIFMGDSGSMMIGYALAVTSLLGAKGSTAVALAVPVLALGLPIMDTLLAIVRRMLERRPVFSADRGHLHHRLVEMGLTHRRAVLVLYGASVVFTAAAIATYLGKDWEVGLALALAAIIAFGLVRSVGLFQFRAIRRTQREGHYGDDAERIRRAVPACLDDLRRADSPDGLKAALVGLAEAAGLELIDCRGSCLAGLEGWFWEQNGHGLAGGDLPGDPSGRVRDYVSATFQLPAGVIKFGWISDSGDVSPQAEILLHLVADGVEGTERGGGGEHARYLPR